MGSSQNKDPNLIIFISLAKRVYYAGETVEGVVHIECKAHRPYRQIYIRLSGKEQVNWTQRHGEYTQYYHNERDTYNQEFVLAKFSIGVEVGEYSFPFSLLLPAALPGSFKYQWGDNYIKYLISAYLPPFDQSTQLQMFSRPLHIREPCRLLQKSFSVRDISNAECCGCCCVCGSAELTLESDMVNLYQNQVFHVRGLVDNTRGTTHISGFKIVLRQNLRRISNGGKINDSNDDFVLHQFDIQVPTGTSTPFQSQIAIPVGMLGYTAIGNIICRAYFLDLVAKVKCCYSNPRVSRHVVVNNNIQPELQQQQIKQAPPGWNPKLSNVIAFLNLKPYFYNPMMAISAINQVGASNKLAEINGYSEPMKGINQIGIANQQTQERINY